MTRKPAPGSAASRGGAPFIPRHPPLVTLARRIVPRKPPSAPSRYKPDRTGASCHASTHPKDDDDGTALRHGLAADRGVRAADRLSCGDRKSVVKGKSVSVRVDIGGRRLIKKKISVSLESQSLTIAETDHSSRSIIRYII